MFDVPALFLLKMWGWHGEGSSDLLCPHPPSPARLYGTQCYPKQSLLLLGDTWSCQMSSHRVLGCSGMFVLKGQETLQQTPFTD